MADVGVVGYPDVRLGERVCACVVLRNDSSLNLATLVHYLRDERRVAAMKLPERLLLLPALPRNPNNKVIKATLRDLAKASPPLPPDLSVATT